MRDWLFWFSNLWLRLCFDAVKWERKLSAQSIFEDRLRNNCCNRSYILRTLLEYWNSCIQLHFFCNLLTVFTRQDTFFPMVVKLLKSIFCCLLLEKKYSWILWICMHARAQNGDRYCTVECPSTKVAPSLPHVVSFTPKYRGKITYMGTCIVNAQHVIVFSCSFKIAWIVQFVLFIYFPK